MKGFGIEIKNNLLEPKHIQSMDVAVWLYMFLIDKITSINDKGEGIVLGGKPVKYKEVKEELGISQNTYTKWMDMLIKYPYIITIRTPHGISFRVLKAHKKFIKRFPQISDSQETVIHRKQVSDSRKPVNVNKDTTIQYNSTSVSYKKVFTDMEWRRELMSWRKRGEKVMRNKKFIVKDRKRLLLDQNGKWEEYKPNIKL